MALGILLSRISIQKLLHLRHTAVRLGAEPQLDLDQGLEARVQIGYAQVDELGQLGEELLVEGFVGGAGEFGFALGARELGGVFVGFFDEFLDACAGGVVVEEFVVAFFYACGREGEGEVRELSHENVDRDGARRLEKRKDLKECLGHTFVDVRKVSAESGDGLENCLSG